jgi:release factor glutamine methyltransferase
MSSRTGFLTISEALRQGTTLLDEAAVPAARLTAEVLLAHALKRDRVFLFAHSTDELTELTWIHYGRYLHQRIAGKPTQYITRRQEFFGRDFSVSPDVLIPRPETEFLVSAALERMRPGDRVLDIGCGSGAIAVTIALEYPTVVWANDVSPAALRVAAANARALGADVRFVAADLASAFGSRSFDMIVSNPPYVGLHEADGLQREVRDYEPHVALFGGESGHEMYARIIDQARHVLRPGGWLLFELGWKSLDPVMAMLTGGWSDVQAVDDLAGIPRVLAARICESTIPKD